MKKIKNFLNFLYVCWLTLNLPPPTQLQYDIARYLSNNIKSKIIQAFRGCGKTWITASYVCWRLHLNPNEKIFIVSASKEKALEIANFIKRLISEMEVLKPLKPNPRDNNRDAVSAFDVAGCKISPAPSVKVCGIFGQITGSRATIIIADDIETSENCRSEEMRQKISNAVTEFDNVIVPESNEIIYLGTPHTTQSLYSSLIERGYNCSIWTAKFIGSYNIERYKGCLADFCKSKNETQIGQSTEPTRFPLDVLIDKEMKMGRSKFQMQFMLDPTLSDLEKYPLKCSDLIVMDLDTEKAPEKVVWSSDSTRIINDLICCGFSQDRFYSPTFVSDKWLNYTDKILSIDPSGRGADELAFCILGHLNSQIFLLDIAGVQGGYDERNLEFIVNKAQEWKISKIIVEKNFGGGMFTALLLPVLKRIYPYCVIEEVNAVKGKETRIIDTLEPVLNQHKLIVNKKVIQADFKYSSIYPIEKRTIYNLFYQLTHITKDQGSLSHDDRLDSLELGVSQLVQVMNLDTDEQVKQREDEEIQEMIEKYNIEIGLTPKKNQDYGTWLYL